MNLWIFPFLTWNASVVISRPLIQWFSKITSSVERAFSSVKAGTNPPISPDPAIFTCVHTKKSRSEGTPPIPVKGAIALKKIVKVWMMMMKEGIFAGHPSLALPPSTLPLLPLPHLPLPCLPSTCSPSLNCFLNGKTRAKTVKRELKQQNAN